jgi:hypothetical protein
LELLLTVKVEGNGGVTLPQFVLGGDFVFAGVFDCDVDDFQGGKIRMAILVYGKLKQKGRKHKVMLVLGPYTYPLSGEEQPGP